MFHLETIENAHNAMANTQRTYLEETTPNIETFNCK
jgi:hypothetical protein